ncbi:MAG TPA: deoxyribonuclease IV, partial [Candidatus Mcinerneyibacteriales bacterium]|nr:deoxyribonuclease IV [Candidatus Mcinerneyibacteriales bacterium]
MKYFGAHVSAAGGVDKAPQRAVEIGASAFALFTKNQRQWSAPPLREEECFSFREEMDKGGFLPENVLPHDSYLINIAQPEENKRERALKAFIDEAKRVEQLGLKKLNFHPGSSLGVLEPSRTLGLIAEGLSRAIDETESCLFVIENTAGQGSQAGSSMEEIAAIISRVGQKERVGVCIDTCHAYAAGYDLKEETGYEEFWNLFDDLLGLDTLQGMHLNDSKKELGSRVDR